MTHSTTTLTRHRSRQAKTIISTDTTIGRYHILHRECDTPDPNDPNVQQVPVVTPADQYEQGLMEHLNTQNKVQLMADLFNLIDDPANKQFVDDIVIAGTRNEYKSIVPRSNITSIHSRFGSSKTSISANFGCVSTRTASSMSIVPVCLNRNDYLIIKHEEFNVCKSKC